MKHIYTFITKHTTFLICFICLLTTIIYFFPMFWHLVLLPLDLLISNHAPWLLRGTILVKNPFMEDSIIQMYPWRYITFQALNQGIIPFWNPYSFMGTPFLASMKPMVFYPLTLLLFKLGPIYGWNILLFLQVFLALFFSYLFIHDYKISPLASFLGSLVFALNSLMMGVLEFGSEGHVLLWFPLIFFLIKRFYDKKTYWMLPILSFSVAASILAGQFQYFFYYMLFVALFILFYGYKSKTHIRNILLLFISLGLGVGISAIQLLPTFELLHYVNRSTDFSKQFFLESLMQPIRFLRLLSPDFFGNPVKTAYSLNYIEGSGYFGIIPLFFTLYAVLFAKKTFPLWFFIVMALTGMFFSLQIFGQFIPLTHIQILYYGSGYRFFSLIYLPAALLTGIGVMEFLTSNKTKQKLIFLSLYSSIVLTIFGSIAIFKSFYSSYAVTLNNVQLQLLFAVILFVITGTYLLFQKYKYISLLFLVLIILLTFGDVFRMGYRFLTYSNTQFLYPQTAATAYVQDHTQTSLARVYGLFDPEVGALFHIATPEIYNPLYLQSSRAVMDALTQTHENSLSTASTYLLNSREGLPLKHTFDILGVKYFAIGHDENVAQAYFHSKNLENLFTKPIFTSEKFDIYQNNQTYPRFGVFYKITSVTNQQEALRVVANPKTDLQTNLVLESPSFIPQKAGTAHVRVVSYGMNTARFTVQTTAPGYFYLSDTYYPGWKVTINGVEKPILRANANFRAVAIPQGKSVIIFTYVPPTFYLGAFLSLLALTASMLLPFILRLLP